MPSEQPGKRPIKPLALTFGGKRKGQNMRHISRIIALIVATCISFGQHVKASLDLPYPPAVIVGVSWFYPARGIRMRRFLLAAFAFLAFSPAFAADSFPGPRVRNSAPFNNAKTLVLSGATCPKSYSSTEYATTRSQILNDVKTCVRDSFGISKDIGLDYGSGRYSECIVPETYDTRGASNNPIWPVCCAREDNQHNYRFVCQAYITPG